MSISELFSPNNDNLYCNTLNSITLNTVTLNASVENITTLNVTTLTAATINSTTINTVELTASDTITASGDIACQNLNAVNNVTGSTALFATGSFGNYLNTVVIPVVSSSVNFTQSGGSMTATLSANPAFVQVNGYVLGTVDGINPYSFNFAIPLSRTLSGNFTDLVSANGVGLSKSSGIGTFLEGGAFIQSVTGTQNVMISCNSTTATTVYINFTFTYFR